MQEDIQKLQFLVTMIESEEIWIDQSGKVGQSGKDSPSIKPIYTEFVSTGLKKKLKDAVSDFNKKYKECKDDDLSSVEFDAPVLKRIQDAIHGIEAFRAKHLENTKNTILDTINKNFNDFYRKAIFDYVDVLEIFKPKPTKSKTTLVEKSVNSKERKKEKTKKKKKEDNPLSIVECSARERCPNFLKKHCEKASHPPRPCPDKTNCVDFSEEHCTRLTHSRRKCHYGDDCDLIYKLHFDTCDHR